MKRGSAWRRRRRGRWRCALLAPAGAARRSRTARSGAGSRAPPGGPPPAADGAERDDIARVLERVEAEEDAGRLESACAHARAGVAPLRGRRARRRPGFAWASCGSQLGRYREAAAAYAAVVADGAADAAVYANFAEVLMAAGRLPDAEARYRDAISARRPIWASAIAASARTSWRSPTTGWRSRWIATSSRSPRARRCCARWRTIRRRRCSRSRRRRAATCSSFPTATSFYYLGLAAEAEGRDGDAEAAFREFIARAPREPLGARRGGAPRQEADGAARRAPAPAERCRGSSRTEPCWRRAASRRRSSTPPGATSCRFSTNAWTACACRRTRRCASRSRWTSTRAEKLTRVIAKVPAPFDERFARCVESATKTAAALLGVPAGAADDGAHRDGHRRPVERSPRAPIPAVARTGGRRGIRGRSWCAARSRVTSPSKGRSAWARAASPRSWGRSCPRG